MLSRIYNQKMIFSFPTLCYCPCVCIYVVMDAWVCPSLCICVVYTGDNFTLADRFHETLPPTKKK